MPDNNGEDFYRNFSARSQQTTSNASKHPATPVVKERGGCLSAFLIVIALINVIGLLFLLAQDQASYEEAGANISQSLIDFVNIVGIFVTVIILLAISALWNFKRWGYYGIGMGYGLFCITNLCGGDLPGLMFSVVVLGLLVYLVKPIEHLLE